MKTIKFIAICVFFLTIIMTCVSCESRSGKRINAQTTMEEMLAPQEGAMKILAKNGYISIEDSIFSYDYKRGSLTTEQLQSLTEISEDYAVLHLQPYSEQ